VASAQFRLAFQQMPRSEARGASLPASVHRSLTRMEKKIVSEELEEISRWFLSSSEERKAALKVNESEESRLHRPESEFEIDESVGIRRRISFSSSQNGQNEMKACLLKHLQDNYAILRVELKKTTEQIQPKEKKQIKEEVLLYIKDSP
jgi:hypothetical protein